MRRPSVAVVLLFLLSVPAAAIDIGPARVEVANAGECARSNKRCLAAAGDARAHVLVWVQETEGVTSRLFATNGGTPLLVFEGRRIDQPSVAADGRSALVIWQHRVVGTQHLAARQFWPDGTMKSPLPADGVVLAGTPDPAAGVVWTGLDYALALPDSLLRVTDGAVTSRKAYAKPEQPFGAMLAANGSSILVVREVVRWRWTGGFGWAPLTRHQYSATTSSLIGGPAIDLMDTPADAHARSLAAGGDGYLFVWKDKLKVVALRLDQNGRVVNARSSVSRFLREGGATAVATTRDGWLVMWDDEDANGEPAVMAVELDADGDSVSPLVVLASGARSPSIVTLAGDRFRVFYRTASAIESRVVATGAENVAPSKRRSVR